MKQLIISLLFLSVINIYGQQQVFKLGGNDTIYYDPSNPPQMYKVGVTYLPRIVTIYASDYGFSPDSSASQNTLAWYSLPDADTIKICEPGTYEIDSTLWMKSNTVYVFCSGDTLEKATGSSFTHVLANIGCLTGVRDENISVYGNGLVINANGIDNVDAESIYKMRGQINFFHVDNLVLDSIYNDDNSTNQYYGHFADVNGFTITGMTCYGAKDGLHFIGCSNGTLTNIFTDTSDDAIVLLQNNGENITPFLGDMENITINNWTNSSTRRVGGAAMRIASASWDDWKSGNKYEVADLCVNNGRIYIKENDTIRTASVAPTHTSGSVRGADNIVWGYIQDGTITEANIKNVTLNNCHFNGSDSPFNISADDWVAYRSYYPGTAGNSFINNLTVDNATWTTSTNNAFFGCSGVIQKITLKNATLNSGITGDIFLATNDSNQVRIDTIIVDNCDITLTASSYLIHKTSKSTGKIINILNSDIKLAGQRLIDIGGTEHIDYTLTNDSIDAMGEMLLSGVAWNGDVVTTNCDFTNPVRILYRNSASSGALTYTSNNCSYDDASGAFLWYISSGSPASSLTLNVTNSTRNETITQTKIASKRVDITSCDLFDHLAYVGEKWGGGRVVYLNNDRNTGMVMDTVDMTASVWGCSGTSITGLNINVGYGDDNTAAILAQCADAGIAARLCDESTRNGYTDWYLPSGSEMQEMYNNKTILGTIHPTNFYWTSNQVIDGSWAQAYRMTDGANSKQKISSYISRAFRNF